MYIHEQGTEIWWTSVAGMWVAHQVRDTDMIDISGYGVEIRLNRNQWENLKLFVDRVFSILDHHVRKNG